MQNEVLRFDCTEMVEMIAISIGSLGDVVEISAPHSESLNQTALDNSLFGSGLTTIGGEWPRTGDGGVTLTRVPPLRTITWKAYGGSRTVADPDQPGGTNPKYAYLYVQTVAPDSSNPTGGTYTVDGHSYSRNDPPSLLTSDNWTVTGYAGNGGFMIVSTITGTRSLPSYDLSTLQFHSDSDDHDVVDVTSSHDGSGAGSPQQYLLYVSGNSDSPSFAGYVVGGSQDADFSYGAISHGAFFLDVTTTTLRTHFLQSMVPVAAVQVVSATSRLLVFRIILAGTYSTLAGDIVTPNGSTAAGELTDTTTMTVATEASGLAAADPDAIADALLDRTDAVDGLTTRQTLQVVGAILAGKVSGARTGTEVFRGLNGDVRVTVLADTEGNRTSVTFSF